MKGIEGRREEIRITKTEEEKKRGEKRSLDEGSRERRRGGEGRGEERSVEELCEREGSGGVEKNREE